jgi:hypothetical protein
VELATPHTSQKTPERCSTPLLIVNCHTGWVPYFRRELIRKDSCLFDVCPRTGPCTQRVPAEVASGRQVRRRQAAVWACATDAGDISNRGDDRVTGRIAHRHGSEVDADDAVTVEQSNR